MVQILNLVDDSNYQLTEEDKTKNTKLMLVDGTIIDISSENNEINRFVEDLRNDRKQSPTVF